MKTPVPLKLEEGDMPLNTFSNKAPFIGKVVSVERIVGPKATGETCNIVIKTEVRGVLAWECSDRPMGLPSICLLLAGQDPLLGGVSGVDCFFPSHPTTHALSPSFISSHSQSYGVIPPVRKRSGRIRAVIGVRISGSKLNG